MSRQISLHLHWIAAAMLLGQALTAGAADSPASHPVAGLAPYARPQGAPVVGRFAASPESRAQWTHGIEGDQTTGLGFLKNQEAWYSPFTRPGMPGYYDIRGWHRAPEKR